MKIKKEDQCCGNCGHYDKLARMAYKMGQREVVAMCDHMLILRECVDKCAAWTGVKSESVRRAKR